MPASHFPIFDQAIAEGRKVSIMGPGLGPKHVLISREGAKSKIFAGEALDVRNALAMAARHYDTGEEQLRTKPMDGEPTLAEQNANDWTLGGGTLSAVKGTQGVTLTASNTYEPARRHVIQARTLREALEKLSEHLPTEPPEPHARMEHRPPRDR